MDAKIKPALVEVATILRDRQAGCPRATADNAFGCVGTESACGYCLTNLMLNLLEKA